MAVNFIIIDDEPQARRLVETYLKHFADWSLKGQFGSALEAYDVLTTNKIDVMFLDVNMPILKGTDFIRSLNDAPLIILTTAYEKYAIESYTLNVLDYLLKPISLERLVISVNKAEEKLRSSISSNYNDDSPFVFVKTECNILKLRKDEILYLEAMQNYVKLVTQNGTHIINNTMKLMEEMFHPPDYIRIHKSYIIPLASITKIEGNRVYCGKKELPIGGHYKTGLMQHIKPV